MTLCRLPCLPVKSEFQLPCLVLVLQDDDDGHLTVLQVLQEVMNKGGALFLDHFARLGLFGKVLSLAGPLENEDGATAKDDKVKSIATEGKKLLSRGEFCFHENYLCVNLPEIGINKELWFVNYSALILPHGHWICLSLPGPVPWSSHLIVI